MTNRTFTIGDKQYTAKHPYSFNAANAILLLAKSGADKAREAEISVNVQQEFFLGIEVTQETAIKLARDVLVDEQGNAFKENDFYNPDIVPPDDIHNFFLNFPYLDDVTQLLEVHKYLRELIFKHPPQDESKGLVPMLESVPESVQVGDQHYKLSPFSFGMQGTVSNIVKFGRTVQDSLVHLDARYRSTNPAEQFLDGFILGGGNGVNPLRFVQGLLLRKHGNLIPLKDIPEMPGLDVYTAIFTAIRSPSLQTFLRSFPWDKVKTAEVSVPPIPNNQLN